MTEMKDPVRLQIGGSSEVKDLLRSASADAPSRTQLDLLAARLAPVVTAAPVTTTASLAPWIVAGIAIVGSAAVIWSTRDRSPAAPPPSPPAYVAPAPAVTPAETPSPPATAPVAVEAAVEAPRPTLAKPRSRAIESPGAAKPAPVEPPAPRPREIELLDAAHRALSTGAAQRALDLADDHAELYATGSLIEEREAIAIEALHRLGHDDQARTRFKNFIVSFPRSGYRARLDHLLDKQP